MPRSGDSKTAEPPEQGTLMRQDDLPVGDTGGRITLRAYSLLVECPFMILAGALGRFQGLHNGLILAGIDLHQEIAFFDRRIVIDE